MPLITTEKQFESDIAAALLSPAGGYTRNGDCYDPKLGLFVDTLIRFVQKTQPIKGGIRVPVLLNVNTIGIAKSR